MMRSPGEPPLSRTANPFMPGSWEPGRFHLTDALVLKSALVSMALVRGLDYLLPTDMVTGPISETMRSAFPLEWWGTVMIVLGLTLGVGIVARVHFAVWIAHGLLAVVYLTLFVSLMSVYVTRPLFDGVRSASVLLAPLILHTLLSFRTGWRPPRWNMEEDEDA